MEHGREGMTNKGDPHPCTQKETKKKKLRKYITENKIKEYFGESGLVIKMSFETSHKLRT